MLSRVKAFAENPWVNLVGGGTLLVTATMEIFERTGEGGFHLGHGLLIFALVQVLQVLPHLVEGADEMSKFTGED